jgi:predicted transcriptional regulator
MYETVPGGKVAAMAEVAAIDEGTPSQIWKRHGERAAISKQEFFAYFDESESGCAIVLENVVPMEKPLKLSELRESLGNFVAPQFYRRLAIDGAELSLFRERASKPRVGRESLHVTSTCGRTKHRAASPIGDA